MVTEAYFHPYSREIKHNICSCTKSFTSALVGIAIHEGAIQGINQKIVDFFPERTIANRDSRKERLTLQHLLTMSSGIDWSEWGMPYYSSNNTCYKMEQSSDWSQFVLDQPVTDEPGSKFNYNSGGSYLLSAILQQATGQNEFTYATEHLFQPLGITDAVWPFNPNGVNTGSGGLQLTPLDMAKFGYLFLRKGRWKGRQIIPQAWVETSTQKQIDNIYAAGYGYQWWIDSVESYSARGWGGQYIFVAPKLDLVVVFTSGLANSFLPVNLMQSFVIPAIKTDKALPLNLRQKVALQKLLGELQNPEPQPVPPLPKMAEKISAKTFQLETNSNNIDAVTLRFKEGPGCWLTISQARNSVELPVGLDGRYQISQSPMGPVALKGCWADENTFVIDWQTLVSPDKNSFVCSFEDDKVKIVQWGTVEN